MAYGRHTISAEKLYDARSWDDALRINTLDAFEAYLVEHPNGKYIQQAHDKQDNLSWENAVKTNSIEAYELYTQRYPQGKYIQLAQEKQDSLDWEIAIHEHMVSSYEKYLRTYTSGKHVTYARMVMEDLRKHPEISWLRKMKTAKVSVNDSYGRASKIAQPLREIIASCLDCVGVKLVPDRATDCDISINIVVWYKARGADYYNGGASHYLYTGASLHGDIIFKGQGTLRCVERFSADIYPPSIASIIVWDGRPSLPSTENLAPMPTGSYIDKLVETFGRVFGFTFWAAALRDYRTEFSMPAARELATIGGSSVDSILQSASAKRKAAIWACGEVNDSRVIVPLIDALKSNDFEVRYEAVMALGKKNDDRILVSLIEALKDDTRNVRSAASIVLGKIKDKRATLPLIEALKSCDGLSEAAEALIAMADTSSVEPLTKVLQEDSSKYVRFYTAWILGELGDKRAVKSLINALEDKDEDVRYKSWKALKKITMVNISNNIVLWQNWWHQYKSNN
jgi:hypothetical protein